MTKLEQAGFAVAGALLAGYPKGNEQIDYTEVRTLICRAYVCGAVAHKKQERVQPKGLAAEKILSIVALLNKETGRSFRPAGSTACLINARLKDPGVTVEGMIKMIRRQCEKWKGTNMEEFLRPSTLFRASNFENYYTAKDLPANVNAPVKKTRRFGDVAYDY